MSTFNLTYPCVDLHCHTVASDGSLTLEELHSLGRAAGLAAMAVTDHDTMAAWKPLGCEIARFSNPVIVPGVELSTNIEGLHGSAHLIALGIPPSGAISKKLDWIKDSRCERNRKILAKLEEMGIRIDEQSREEILTREVGGRAHFASLLVREGSAASMDEAFELFLNRGRPAYVERERLSIEEAIDTIHADGGVSILCHPIYLPLEREDLAALLTKLKESGLDGVEILYSDYSMEFQNWISREAKRAGLLGSGGSDFHGELKPGITIGVGRGELAVPRQFYDELLERVETIRSATEE